MQFIFFGIKLLYVLTESSWHIYARQAIYYTYVMWKSVKYFIFWLCVCSCRYPAGNTFARYLCLWPDRLYVAFRHYLIKGTIFEKKKIIENKVCVLFSLRVLSETLFILRITRRDMTINVYWSSCKVHSVLARFQLGLNYLDRFSQNTQTSNLMKIPPLEAESFHAEGRTDRQDKANNRFSQFCQIT